MSVTSDAPSVLVRAGLCAAALSLAVPLHADPVPITAGALVGTSLSGSGSRVTLIGEGFTFEGGTGFGVFAPGDCDPCTAGSTLDLHAFWIGLDLGGTATVGTQTFTGVGSISGLSTASAEWTGSLTIPAEFEGGTLTAPFLFTGFFRYALSPMDPIHRIDLTGHGLASLTFGVSSAFPGTLSLREYRYEFAADPVPEPTSMLLIGTGLAGLAVLRRRRT